MSNELLKRIFSSIVLIPIIFISIIKGEFYFNILLRKFILKGRKITVKQTIELNVHSYLPMKL